MSKTIDERVVSMQFNNKHFENNVKTSMSTLDRLKQSLKFEGAAKGFDSISSSAKRVDVSPLAKGLESVKVKFSALEVMAVTALSNITNSAVNAGKKLISAFTIDPIKTGFQEYETQIGAIQTILANTSSKGTTLEQVNAALDELNTYADKTIYNFTEMTKNIGTFTAAGLDLETSTKAIQGIANLAAVSGSTSQQASTAMYQLSQALASGSIRLQDWNSVVNAGMGGKVFQDAIINTIKGYKEIDQSAVEAYESGVSFRDLLNQQDYGAWFTSDLLAETLKKFTKSGAVEYLADLSGGTKKSIRELQQLGDTSGYSSEEFNKFALSIAKGDEAMAKTIVETLTMADTAEKAATEVKTFTQLMDTLKEAAQSGWTQTWEIIIGDFDEAKKVYTELSDLFSNIIGESSNARNELLSGAFSTGWKQFLNEGIDNEEAFRDTVVEVGKKYGVVNDEMIEKAGSFEESLKENWMTADVLKESMAEYTKKITEMSYEEQEAAGYTQESIDKLTALNEGLQNGSISADEFAKKMGMISGRELAFDSLRNSLDAIFALIRPMKEAFTDIFPPATSEQIYSILEKIKEFTSNLIINEKQASKLKIVFTGLFSVLDIGVEFIKAVGSGIKRLLSHFTGLGGTILDTAVSLGEWLFNLRNTIKETDYFGKIIDNIVSFIENFVVKVIDAAKNFIKFVKEILNTLKVFGLAIKTFFDLTGLSDPISDTVNSFEAWFHSLKKSLSQIDIFSLSIEGVAKVLELATGKIKDFRKFLEDKIKAPGFESFCKLMEQIWTIIGKIGSKIAGVGKSIGQALINAFRSGDINSAIDLFNSGVFAAILIGIKRFVTKAGDSFDEIGGILENVKGILDSVRGCFEAWQQNLKANVLFKIAIAIGILAASLVVLAALDPDKLAAALGSITVLFADLMASLSIFSKISGGMDNVAKASGAMIALSFAVFILAGALKKVSEIDADNLKKGLVGITVLIGEVVGAMLLLSNFSKNAIKGAFQMILFAAAIKILASVCKDLSELSWEELGKGLTGVGAIFAEIAGFMALIKLIKPEKMFSSAVSLVIIGAAMEIFANVCQKFGSMKWEELGKAGAAIGGVLILAAGFALLSGMSKKMFGSSVALVIIAAAMEIFTDVCQKFGSMEWEELGKAGAAIAGLLILAAGFTLLSGMSKKLISSSVSLILISAAMEIFADVCKKFGSMEWEALGKAGAAIGGLLILVTAFVSIAGMSKNIITSAAALLIMSAAIAIFAPAFKTLGNMSWEAIAKGLVAIAAAFVIIGLAGLVLGPIVPAIIGVAAALALVGIAALGIGVGLLAAAAGISALAIAGSTGATAIVAALNIIIVGIADLIPYVVTKIGEAIVAFCKVISSSATAIGEAIKAVVLTTIDVLKECIPPLVDGLLQLIIKVLEALVEYGPTIVGLLYDFLIKIIETMAVKIPELVKAGVNLLMEFFAGVVEALKGIDVNTLVNGIVGIGILSAIMIALAAVALLVPAAMIGVLGMGAVIAEIALVLAAVGALAQIPGLEWLINEGGDLLQSIGTAIGKFVGGIVGGIMTGISEQLPEIATNLSEFMKNIQPFIEYAKSIDESVLIGVGYLSAAILALSIADLVAGVTSILGVGFVELGNQLSGFMESAKGFIDGVSTITPETAESVKSLSAMILTLTAAELLHGISSFLSTITGSDSMSTFGTSLASFGEGIKAFSESIVDITEEDLAKVDIAAKAGERMSTMISTLPASGGWLQTILGDKDLNQFSLSLPVFGMALVLYSQSIKDLTEEDINRINTSASAGQAMSDLLNSLPASGGWLQTLLGDKDLATFGLSLPIFGMALVAYAESIRGITEEDSKTMSTSVKAASSLSDLLNSLPPSGGWLQKILGDKDLATFGTSLVTFGAGLKAYITSIRGINDDSIASITKSGAAVDALKEVLEKVPTSGSWWGAIFGEKDGQSFGDAIYSLGTGIKKYITSIKGINDDTITSIGNSKKAIEAIAGAAKKVPTDNSTYANAGDFMTKMHTMVTNVLKYIKQASGITDSSITAINNSKTAVATIVDASTTLSNISSATVGSAATNIAKLTKVITNLASANFTGVDKFKNALDKLATTDIGAFVNAFTNAGPKVATAVNKMLSAMTAAVKSKTGVTKQTFGIFVTECLKAVTDKTTDFKTAGTKIVTALTTALSSGGSKIKNVFSSALKSCVAAIKTYYNSFYNAGAYVAKGFAKGIEINAYVAKQKATSMAKAAASAAKEALKEHSPSKVFYEIGANGGKGLVNALVDYEDKSYDAGYDVATSASKGLGTAMNKVSDAINSDINIQPSITPVIDMNKLNRSRLHLTSSIDASMIKPVGSLSRIVREAQDEINASNNKVVNAIKELREDLGLYFNDDEKEIALYVDSKKLATSLAKPMDRQLNILSKKGAY